MGYTRVKTHLEVTIVSKLGELFHPFKTERFYQATFITGLYIIDPFRSISDIPS